MTQALCLWCVMCVQRECGVLGVSAFQNMHREHSSIFLLLLEMVIRSSQYNWSLSSAAAQAAATYCDLLAERDQICDVQSPGTWSCSVAVASSPSPLRLRYSFGGSEEFLKWKRLRVLCRGNCCNALNCAHRDCKPLRGLSDEWFWRHRDGLGHEPGANCNGWDWCGCSHCSNLN